jgi:hypothetical protein
LLKVSPVAARISHPNLSDAPMGVNGDRKPLTNS